MGLEQLRGWHKPLTIILDPEGYVVILFDEEHQRGEFLEILPPGDLWKFGRCNMKDGKYRIAWKLSDLSGTQGFKL